ncbi:protein of unknown function [Ectopseudomonas oleovorans]|nr:protein of unknown function [Pseudomonas oleovorans]
MSPTSYQTAPSRVCGSAFYRQISSCQPLFARKLFSTQMLSVKRSLDFRGQARLGKAARGGCAANPWGCSTPMRGPPQSTVGSPR